MKKYTIGIQDGEGQWLASATIRAASDEGAWNRIGELFAPGTLAYSDYAIIEDADSGEKLYAGIGREYRKIKPNSDEDKYYLAQRAAN